METLTAIKERLTRTQSRLKDLETEYINKTRGDNYKARKELLIREMTHISIAIDELGRGSIFVIIARVIELELIKPGKIIESKDWKAISYYVTTKDEDDATFLFQRDYGDKYEIKDLKVKKIISRKMISE